MRPSVLFAAVVAARACGPATDAVCKCQTRPAIELYRGADPAVRLRDGDRAVEGDRVQVAYRAPPDVDGAIVSIDGRGVVTEHLPPGRLREGRVFLDRSFVLDDAPDYERFILLVGDADAVQDAIHALERGRDPPEDVVGAALELVKTDP